MNFPLLSRLSLRKTLVFALSVLCLATNAQEVPKPKFIEPGDKLYKKPEDRIKIW